MPDWLITEVEAGDALTDSELYEMEEELEREHRDLMDSLDESHRQAVETLSASIREGF